MRAKFDRLLIIDCSMTDKSRFISVSLRLAGIASLSAILFSGCASDASVKERIPRYKPLAMVTAASGQINKAESAIVDALRYGRRDPLLALGKNMLAAQASLAQLKANPQDAVALNDYNFATARILGLIKEAKLDPWSAPLMVPTSNGPMLLSHKPDSRPQWNPALYTFAPADQFDIDGTYVKEHAIRPGIGAPLVAIGKGLNKEWRSNYGFKKTYYGVTAVVSFKGNKCVIEFFDPLNTETVPLDGHVYQLSADFTVPMAVLLASSAPNMPKLQRMLWPEKYAETAHLSRLEPYNPNKTVVLVIHGLMDSPSTWAPMIINLRSNPEIRQHYQFWFFSYPSGYPYPYSAAILRKELDGAEKKYHLTKPIVVIGHSMGGCISRLLITDTGDQLWKLQFGKAPDQTNLTPASRTLLEDSLIFSHRPEIGRVIFISSPLKGSDIARNPLGRIGSMLIRTPSNLLLVGKDTLKLIAFQSGDLRIKRAPNSIDTLSPNNRFVRNINTLPITQGIPYHTIIGDQGKGGSPHSSDGVVPYWSSHMDGAVSECIVPSGHGAHQNRQAFAEVARILILNEKK
jgi:pimeloyl-ACP methyl ester carboxylesterase